ncbi:hypothetical protein CDD81_7140 [Ophiocordyceps australis]|uniref:SP-RING-type domain-containing protein n=1 Tax=Ophiocordyceps australis TaxID=1399860 RepID=A0A2C5Y6C4_9HYPO|nr:hypothetical protein CDD81_7140 [Ophiocordyceps australis]
MASPQPSSASLSRHEVSALVKQVQSSQFFNRQLSSICQVNGLKTTGVKAELQRRIVDLITEAVNAGDVPRLHQIRQSIINAAGQRSSPSSKNFVTADSSLNLSSSPLSAHLSHSVTSFGDRDSPYSQPSFSSRGMPWASDMTPLINFRPSPFFQPDPGFSVLRVCEAMSQHRNSLSITIRVGDHRALQKCLDDKSYRIMVFCAAESTGTQDVAFPHQAELKVNGDDIKANLRGLKNKPGSTRPVDITSALRLKPNYSNNVEFLYALTSKKFFLVVNLCKTTPVTELVAAISGGRKIPRASVVNEINKKSQDADVVATSQVLSLKCPLSCMRLDVPCRGLACNHIQCFDATSYLQLQEQGPQWLCPICNRPASFDQLAVDEYVRDILDNTTKDTETVTIEPDGRWWTRKPDGEQPYLSRDGAVDDDDFCEISSVSVNGRRGDNTKNTTPHPANGPRGIGSASAKRPAAAVIDLTGDSDDDNFPPSPKRHNVMTNGLRSSSTDLGP